MAKRPDVPSLLILYGCVVNMFLYCVAFMCSDVQSATAPLRCDGRSPPAVVVVVASAVVDDDDDDESR